MLGANLSAHAHKLVGRRCGTASNTRTRSDTVVANAGNLADALVNRAERINYLLVSGTPRHTPHTNKKTVDNIE